jgi:cyclopropane-fatty-acyl-phospholipid synthase
MNSRVCVGEVHHVRSAPVRHEFRYPVYFYAFDLDELPTLGSESRLFGYNRVRPVAVHDADYLKRGSESLREKLAATVAARGVPGQLGRAMLVTTARYLHYVFNPVSFFYCWGTDGALLSVVAHVNNTFGESHLYVLAKPVEPRPGQLARYRVPKAFHVSPFFGEEGEYEFQFSPLADRVEISLIYRCAGEHKLTATLSGDTVPFSAAALRRTLLRHPLAPALTMPRILRQAAALHFGKKLPVFQKPVPRHPDTIRVAPPGPLQRFSQTVVLSALGSIRRGTLTLEFPGGESRRFRGPEPGPEAWLRVLDHRFFPQVLLAGDIGLGESFTAGEWESPDLTALIRFFAENLDETRDEKLHQGSPGRRLHHLRHLLRDNTPAGSRKNIRAHYDLGNEFFALFLDLSMTYSCALYEDPAATIEEAQRAKRLAVIRKARLGPGDHLLEIGCGWGAFAIEAARTTGCRVTGITLSQRQLEEARRRVAAAGLADRVTLEFIDYRHVEGRFDRIVSIEMLEAVGHRHLVDFFAACDRLMLRGGRQVHQVITIPDWRYDGYRRNPDWIRKHIFPGGHLPSLAALASAMAGRSRLVVEEVENLGPHYARTLRAWRERLAAHRDEARTLGFDDYFLRAWEYYFSYCEAGFAARYLGDLQLVLIRPGEEG